MDKLGFSWLIPDKIAGHAEPTSSRDVGCLLQLGIRALVRMRETREAAQFHKIVREVAMEDLHIPVEDFTPPTQEELSTIVAFMEHSVAVGKTVAVSCYSGKGRTGTVLAAYLVSAGKCDAESAINTVRQARPNSIECRAQESAVHEFADRKAKGKLPAYRKELIALAALGQEYDFGSNGWDVRHATQVGRLSLNLLQELVRLGIHVEQDTDGLVLEGAALLHDIGRNPKADVRNSEPHHERSFKTLKTSA